MLIRVRACRFCGPFLPTLFLFVSGCANVTFSLQDGMKVPTPEAQYRAYGASITYGATLKDPARQAYPSLVAAHQHMSFANNAISGDQACDVLPRQVFPNKDLSSLEAPPVYSLLIGANDADLKGPGDYEAVYRLCHMAVITWLGLPVERKVVAGAKEFIASGPGVLDRSNPWTAWTTEGKGARVAATISTLDVGPIYAWVVIDDSSPASFGYSLDGETVGLRTSQTSPRIATNNGTGKSIAVLRFPRVSPGIHTVVLTQTNDGASGVSVLGIGAPGRDAAGLPAVLVGTITYQRHGAGGGGCVPGNESPCLEYNRIIESDVDTLAADGLNVRLFDTRKYMYATAAEMNDDIHPNQLGQLELSHAVEAVWPGID